MFVSDGTNAGRLTPRVFKLPFLSVVAGLGVTSMLLNGQNLVELNLLYDS